MKTTLLEALQIRQLLYHNEVQIMKRGIFYYVLTAFFALPALAAAEVHGAYTLPTLLRSLFIP